MKNIKIATAQFENKSGDKKYNLATIEKLTEKAAAQSVWLEKEQDNEKK